MFRLILEDCAYWLTENTCCRYIFEGEERQLRHAIEADIAHKRPVYTNKRRLVLKRVSEDGYRSPEADL